MSGSSPSKPLPKLENVRIAIVRALWNGDITSKLCESARKVLYGAGVPKNDVEVFEVPGAVELTFGASQLIESSQFDAVIVFGCVVRGDTPHFDYVCQSVTQGITYLNSDCDIPVIFGVLTVDRVEDAIERTGGKAGDKGVEAAETALMMIDFVRKVRDL